VSGNPDAIHGPSYEEAVVWEEHASDPTANLRQQFVTGKGLVVLADGVVRSVGEGRGALWQPPVDDRDVDTPPGSPATGYRVVVGSSPTGDFVGHEGEIAQYNGTSWVFTTPQQGQFVFVRDEIALYRQSAASSPWSWGQEAGSGLTADQHKTLRQLIHFIEEGPGEGFTSGAYKETLPSGSVFPTSIIWWESSSKLKKIVERTITWTGVNPTTDEWKVYDTDGSTLLATVSDSISYSGVFETTRTRTITVA